MKVEDWRIAQKCFVVVSVFLFCSMNVAGQEPVDSMTMSKYTQTDFDFLYDSPEKTIDPIEKTIDPTEMTKIYPLDTMFVSHSPAKAAIFSAVVPGLGQVYNRKYWKVPIVYIAIGISVERFITFQNKYNRYRRSYIDIKDNDPYTNYYENLGFPSGYKDDQKLQVITKNKETLRTWRDYAILAVVVTYALNIIDANVDAHLIDFSLEDNISLNIRPCFLENDMNFKKIGLTLRFTF